MLLTFKEYMAIKNIDNPQAAYKFKVTVGQISLYRNAPEKFKVFMSESKDTIVKVLRSSTDG